MRIFPSKNYSKSLKKVLASGKIKITEIDVAVDIISSEQKIPVSFQDHALTGEYMGYRECHIRPDILLIYKVEEGALILVLADIGSHSKLLS